MIWHIEPSWRSHLPAALDDLITSPSAETVKDGLSRTIYRMRSDTVDLHIKQCRPAGIRAWLREWIRPAKALMEFRKIVELAARRIATLEPIAWGRTAGLIPGDSYLITRSLTDAVPLGRYLEFEMPTLVEPLRSRFRQKIATALGGFLAELHLAGVRHRDLHPGNILISWEDETPKFVLIDLHDAKLGRPLSERVRLDNLIPFNRWFILRANRADRLRFWRAYCRRGEWNEMAARSIESRTERSNRRFWRGRESRCMRANRHFHLIDAEGVSGYAVKEFHVAEWRELLSHMGCCHRDASYQLLKDSRSSTITEFDWMIGRVTRRVILKKFHATSMWDGPASLFRSTGALRSWKNGHGFMDGLLPTPRPLAVWQQRRSAMAWDGYLLMEKVEHAIDLRRFWESLQRLPPALSYPLLRSTNDALARLIRLMHGQGWSHRDLKASNILVHHDGRISFIDLVGIRRPKRLSFLRRAQDLSRLNASFLNDPTISRTDRLRFLRMYLNAAFTGAFDWKIWWREIRQATDRKCRRNLRTGRPLA